MGHTVGMAHYRRGRKVPALRPGRRHFVGAITVVAVFSLVGLTAWNPIAALPALGVIVVLGVVDWAIVTASPGADDLPSGPAAFTGDEPEWDGGLDTPTQVLPRLTFGYARASGQDEAYDEPDQDAVRTMAIDMRGYLDEAGPGRMG
ncbi:conserved hypothetical protein [Frankia canadensis]|uniref:Uncharacterized protein n=2 Tax=Frankia canadensis TaxID=1836972 RepID=A0A2I2KTM9_9ACTN|nr:conserved hypothetical protein [Frankia canadensis]SOU56314.1 conserved hypothetical protein [Frankia canadensis]